MKIKSKLYYLTGSTFELPFHVTHDHKVNNTAAYDIPMLTWPDGSWCVLANVYMLELYRRGLSRKNRGGTLHTYAANISHLLRYCFENKIILSEITDNEFSFFIKTLQGERRSNQPEVFARDANSIIAIGRNCLDFLASVGRFYHDETLIGPKGRVRAEQKEFIVKKAGSKKHGGGLVRKYWHHRSFPTPDPKNKRLPISTDAVNRLRDAVQMTSSSIYQRKRRYVMLKLLEITGGRRSEVAALTVDSVYKASSSADQMLKLMTAKKPGGKETYRYVPISGHDVKFLIEFIEMNRHRIIRTTCGRENDDGYVLINERTGKKLMPNTITQEVAILAKYAGIKEKTCPHMFRHRFITKLFVALIEQHEFENSDTFRQALLDSESIKQKIQQWTGHTNLSSLDVYINLAFEEVAGFKKTYNIVNAQRVIHSFKGTLKQFQHELRGGGSSENIAERLSELIDALDEDLEKSQ